ncbi:type II toxin-antitoxin system RatA family toxin [Caulobacter sp. SLTY]|uniref:type II toxin-antitoxin system RatA family toxin n=1 Tax=Caulobacter sp. SLTY TaxID=2683262 RepID=UPI001412008B|nr:SRPBCC family protein [Caulobacter sp. SLTY]NBB15822.1 type II toxin-antitoxin system RatA family toxin [Caulobacter sp. SLTY]
MRHTVTRVLPHEPDLLFQLVGDVEQYPKFVPWVTGMRVWNRREVEPGVNQLDAEAAVTFSFLREKFATRVRRDANARQIDVNLLYGPFRRLRNLWRFVPHPDGCEVTFEIDFEFKVPMLDRLLAANFDTAVAKLMKCFEDRAATLSKGL